MKLQQRVSGPMLGDMWASISYITQQSRYYEETEAWVAPHLLSDAQIFLDSLDLNSVNAKNVSVQSGVEFYDMELLPFNTAFMHKYTPTKIRWENRNSKIICYHFDSTNKNQLKNCELNEISEFFMSLNKRGYRLIDVGHHCNIMSMINLMSISEVYVGLISGPAHVACSVGIPVFMIGNWANPHLQLDGPFWGEDVILYRTMNDFLKEDFETLKSNFQENKRTFIE
jgi:hypothetical protein